MLGKYRIVRIVYDEATPIRFVSSWCGYVQACRVLKTLIDSGDNAFIESYEGGARD